MVHVVARETPTISLHWVRTGLFGHLGRYHASTGEVLARGRRVICRTPRGLEVGTVLGEVFPATESTREATAQDVLPEGELLRRMTAEDELLWARLERDRSAAVHACRE